ncbi:hypothetical protein CC1G_13835 [Coprinopsis cinerea okayama7|uniref:Uncharacterized protein n=1 Tax=Coprinopsis cinerea (strain Okayama-7 / 130 / ATCC MYA-4618 / FGSC 9003) TaxID=240176 RepID=D6RKJ7_COPC7|nr:hypothetical protein CC1G_13835 [Coprinopsis cinerea okayama7\|eukprot:XP_002911800.1 hypothetical protein CC1G_13835 [Coprinopsis cinerea okayama7\
MAASVFHSLFSWPFYLKIEGIIEQPQKCL